MKRKRVLRKRGLTPVVTTSLIIVSLIVAIGIVVVVIYNIIQSDIDVGEVSNVKLSIVENSVKMNDDGSVLFNIERGTDGVDLTKIKFILSDGSNSEELTATATELKESESKEFKVSSKLFTQIKRISIIPIVQTKKGKETVLSVSDSIELNYLGNQVTIQKLSMICGNKKVEVGEECDDGNLVNKDGCSSQCKLESCLEQSSYVCDEGKICPGITLKTNNLSETCCSKACSVPSKQNCSDCGLMCTKEDCNSILEECYFEGGWSNTCTSCSSITCDKYKTLTDCNEDKCLDGCAWSLTLNKCEIKQNCGNDNVETGEQCDNGAENTNIVCVPSYSGSCSYCNTTCSLKTIAGALCGDAICNATLGETCSTCSNDCGACTLPNGQSCTENSNCTSGNCYRDSDSDNYAASSGDKICKASASLGIDCLDTNANVHPGQTSYFSTNRGDGSFDYDCSGGEDKDASGLNTCTSCSACYIGSLNYPINPVTHELSTNLYCNMDCIGQWSVSASYSNDCALSYSCGESFSQQGCKVLSAPCSSDPAGACYPDSAPWGCNVWNGGATWGGGFQVYFWSTSLCDAGTKTCSCK